MKKLLSLLPALLLGLAVSSCSDHDGKDMPDVNISLEYSGGATVDDHIVVEQGQTLSIDGLYVTPAEGTKNATLGLTTYYWDFVPFETTAIVPFQASISTEGMELGHHVLQVRTSIYQIDREMAWGVFSYDVEVVEPSLSNPEPAGGTLVPEARITSAD